MPIATDLRPSAVASCPRAIAPELLAFAIYPIAIPLSIASGEVSVVDLSTFASLPIAIDLTPVTLVLSPTAIELDASLVIAVFVPIAIEPSPVVVEPAPNAIEFLPDAITRLET